MVVNWREKKECGHDAKEGTDKDSVYSSVPLKSVGLNLLVRKSFACQDFGMGTQHCKLFSDSTHFAQSIVTGRNEVVAKVMFLQVCVCPQGGRVSASVHTGMPYPPGWRNTPQMENPPRPGRPPLDGEPPLGPGRPPPRKQTPAYGLRAAGTHPTGMHSCWTLLPN